MVTDDMTFDLKLQQGCADLSWIMMVLVVCDSAGYLILCGRSWPEP